MKSTNKGIVEIGVSVMTAIILAVVAASGTLFAGGVASSAGSGMLLTVAGMTAYSQTPHVKRKFRERKAIGMCESSFLAVANCTETVKAWSDDEILDYIRDDKIAIVSNNGGNFVGGYMNY